MIRLSEVDVNIEWTLDSIEEGKKGKYQQAICYGCSDKKKVKEYVIAVQNNKLAWQDASGPVYEKLKILYCDDCIDEFIDMLANTKS